MARAGLPVPAADARITVCHSRHFPGRTAASLQGRASNESQGIG